jgi:spore coat protein JB
MMNKERDALLKKIQALSFAKVETELYLDVYPDNREALNYYKDTLDALSAAMEEYQNKYAPIVASGVTGDTWTWVKGQWPWQNGNTEKEGAK